MKLQDLKDLVRQAGLVGAGGAGFPTYMKLTAGVDTIILNCAECEPLLKLHRTLLEERAEEILSALSEILTATGAEQGIVAIKAHYHATVRAIERLLPDFPGIRIHLLPSVYPMGDEVVLVKEVTGRTIPAGSLPASVSVTVYNVETVYNVWAAMNGRPVTHKYVTVAGEVAHPATFCVPLGTTVSTLIAWAGGATVGDPAILLGGPMMGKLIDERDVVTKTTNAIVVLPPHHTVVLHKAQNARISLRRAMSVCCQCRSCTELCSRHNIGYPVEPHMVMRVLANGGRGDALRLAGSMYCSGCGLCDAYSCPQDLSPRILINEMKAAARAKGIKPERVELQEVKEPELHRVSLSRLTSRLGLAKYDVPAPLTEAGRVKQVVLPLSQHIGAPAVPCVKVGDSVAEGDVIATAADGLSVNIHASITGKVTAVTARAIKIQA